jgi:glutathione synthase
MRWLFVIDPIEQLNLDTDSTIAIMDEAKNRNIEVSYCTIYDIFFQDKVQALTSDYKTQTKTIEYLESFNLIFMRKEPPYEMNFHYATELLSLSKTLVVNNPEALRDFNEKQIILNFPELIPKTLVTSNMDKIVDFQNKHENIVIKSLSSYQGKGVEKNPSKRTILNHTENGTKPVMVQEFLPGISKGDKRILCLGGEFLGVVNRIPQNTFISNFGAGGKGEKTTLTQKDKQIIQTISPFLKKQGLHFVGLDVIDGFLTEINITCPTGIVQINSIENKHIEKEVVDYLQHIVTISPTKK